MASATTWRAARGLLAGLLIAGAATGNSVSRSAGGDELTSLDRSVMATLSALRETSRATVHHEPGAIAQAALDDACAANDAEIAALEKRLAMKYRGKVHFFLYRDVPEMVERTGAGGGTVAFSTGTVSIHQAHDFRGCHELVHLFALQFPAVADGSGADGFVVEGLATALAESDEGVPIPAWGAAYAKLGLLPESLQEFRRRWPDGARQGVHPYHVAGDFLGWLVECHGIAKVKQWYVDAAEAHRWLGKGFGQLEREWREAVAKRPLAKEHLDHVRRKLGLGGEPPPDAFAKAKGRALFEAKGAKPGAGPPAGLVAERPACWKVEAGALVGTNAEAWTHLATAQAHPARVGVRARLRLVRGDAVKLRVNGDRELVLANWSSYLKVGEGFAGNDRIKLKPGEWHDVLLVNDAGRARAWLDDEPLFDLPGAWSDAGEGSLALAVEKGVVEIERWELFDAGG